VAATSPKGSNPNLCAFCNSCDLLHVPLFERAKVFIEPPGFVRTGFR
jgi:hypothetical protein